MDGDSGATVGCAGNVVWPADNAISDFICDCLSKLPAHEAFGLLDVNCLVNEEGVWWIEWTPRFGYDAAPALFCKGLHGELGKLFSDLARGQLKQAPLLDQFSSAIRLSLPPYPKREEDFQPWPLRGVKNLDDFYGYSINKVDGQIMITNTEIGCVLGKGSTIKSSIESAMKVANGIPMGQLQYRKDLAERFQKRYSQLEDAARVLEAA